ncbi:MAG: hypothetical protein EB078_00670 [Proteobacteria bacterium]|nr:hypothetical protein [Pseudomonadota bacterium]NDD03392.1 hypothetical protein [Pseudomonadota bacterium]
MDFPNQEKKRLKPSKTSFDACLASVRVVDQKIWAIRLSTFLRKPTVKTFWNIGDDMQNFLKGLCLVMTLIAGQSVAASMSDVYSLMGSIQSALSQNNPLYNQSDINQIYRSLEQAYRAANLTGSGGNGEVVSACASVFGSGSFGSQCASHARNADVVRACGWGFGSGQVGLSCATSASHSDVVEACVLGFGSGASGQKCASQARDAGRVRACVRQFGSGASGLNCAIGH